MVDFVEEVEEQLRAERYADLVRRFLPWVAAAFAAGIVGWLAAWGYNSWMDHRIATASIAYDKGVVALAGGDQDGAFHDFESVAKDGPPGYRTLALMQQGDIRYSGEKTEEAISLFDQAAKAAPNAVLGDLARLRAAQAAMDIAPYAQVETRLKALIGDRKPYALQAKEMLAMAKLQAGKTQEARGDFNALSLTLGVTPAMRSRAQGAIALIDAGQGALVGQVVNAAATLPPSPGWNVQQLLGAPAPGGAAGAQDQGDASGQPSDQDPSGNPQ